MDPKMATRKAIQGGLIERRMGRDLPHAPVDGYRKTTAAQRKRETVYYVQKGQL